MCWRRGPVVLPLGAQLLTDETVRPVDPLRASNQSPDRWAAELTKLNLQNKLLG